MKIGEYKQMMSNLTRPGTPEQNKKAEENNKKYLADRKAKTLKEYGLDKPIEEQPGYDVSKDQNLLRRIKMYSSETLGAEFDKAIAAEDEALKKLGRDPMNILQRNNVKKFDNNDPSTYPSNPEQRKKLMAQQKLEILKKDKPFIKKKITTTPINIPIPTIDPKIFHRAINPVKKVPTPETVQRKMNLEDDPKYRNTIFGSDTFYRRKRGFDE
jgi:hypothetical protein